MKYCAHYNTNRNCYASIVSDTNYILLGTIYIVNCTVRNVRKFLCYKGNVKFDDTAQHWSIIGKNVAEDRLPITCCC